MNLLGCAAQPRSREPIGESSERVKLSETKTLCWKPVCGKSAMNEVKVEPTTKPRVTLAILTYNQESYIRDSLQSALMQDYPNLEVVVCDDSSRDRTFEIITDLVASYSGPHVVSISRNSRNLGLAGNFNSAWRLSSGELVVFQAGDDVSRADRVSRMVCEWEKTDRKVDLISSSIQKIDIAGEKIGEVVHFVQATPTFDDLVFLRREVLFFLGGANAYSRRLYDICGPLDDLASFEDVAFTFRAALGGGFAYVKEPLLYYRVHENCMTSQYFTREMGVRDADSQRWVTVRIGILRDRLKSLEAYGRATLALKVRIRRKIAAEELMLKFITGTLSQKCSAMMLAVINLKIRSVIRMVRAVKVASG